MVGICWSVWCEEFLILNLPVSFKPLYIGSQYPDILYYISEVSLDSLAGNIHGGTTAAHTCLAVLLLLPVEAVFNGGSGVCAAQGFAGRGGSMRFPGASVAWLQECAHRNACCCSATLLLACMQCYRRKVQMLAAAMRSGGALSLLVCHFFV